MRRNVVGRGVAALVVLAVAGAGPAVPSAGRPDPAIIVVRNDSEADLERVALEAARPRRDAPQRLGSVSPVPRGVAQSVTRSSRRRPLDRHILVTWTVRGGGEFSREVDLKPILHGATGARDEALVIRIGRGQTLAVSLETVDPEDPGGHEPRRD